MESGKNRFINVPTFDEKELEIIEKLKEKFSLAEKLIIGLQKPEIKEFIRQYIKPNGTVLWKQEFEEWLKDQELDGSINNNMNNSESVAKILQSSPKDTQYRDGRGNISPNPQFPTVPQGTMGNFPTTSPHSPHSPTISPTYGEDIDIMLKAIGRVLPKNKVDRPYKKLAFYILYKNKEVSEEELRRKIVEYGKKILKQEYEQKSIINAMSAIKTSGVVYTRKDDTTGITYYRLSDEKREAILKEYKFLLMEKEVQEKIELEQEIKKDELVRKALIFFTEYYKEKIFDLFNVEGKEYLVVDWKDLEVYMPPLAEAVIDNPEMAIEAMEEALLVFQQEEMFRKVPRHIEIHLTNVGSLLKPSDIKAKHVGRMVELKALVSSSSDVMSYYSEPVYICKTCGNQMKFVSTSPLKPIPKTKECSACGSTLVELSESLSKKADLQFFELQDSPEDISGGEPRRIVAYVIGPQAGIPKVGMRVRVTAIVRERIFKKGDSPVFDRVLEVNHIELLDKAMSANELNENDIIMIQSLKEKYGEDLPKAIVRSIAPHLYGMDTEKLALALAIVGGVKTPAKSRPHIHVLYIGDPGVAKTELLLDLENIAPKAIIATGTGSTGVGLTATVRKNEFKKGDYVIVGGALVLASGGVCGIDEIDKMKQEHIEDLHTAIEQQIIPINKAGISTKLKIDTTIVATANPMGGKLNPNEPIAKQLTFKPTLLNRFDMIFIVRDNLDDEKFLDEVTDHLLEINDVEEVPREISPDLLRKFFAYARSLRPKFTHEAKQVLKKEFARLRKTYSGGAVPINLRYQNALMRIAEAHAKLRLSETVEPNDVKTAVSLIERSFKDIATNPETGKVDIGYIVVGASKEELVLRDQILQVISSLESVYPNGVPKGLILTTFKEKGVDKEKVLEFLKQLVIEGRLLVPEVDKYKVRR